MFFATAIILLDGPRFGRPKILASIVVMNRYVAPVFRMPMAIRAWSLLPSRPGVYVVLQVCVVETGSLNFTRWPVVWRMGLVRTVGGEAHTWWFDCIALKIF